MTNIVKELTEKGIAHPPRWLPDNMHYLTMMGSVAYGVSSDTSDMDLYGLCIPTKEELFPHMRGEIIGFGNLKHGGSRFTNYQEHHLMDTDAMGGKGRSHDLNIYNIVDYFQLVMENNPNMIDSLFTADWCVQHITRVGTIIRENRKLFLHRGSWHTFKGYAYAQVKKMKPSQYPHCPKCDKHAQYPLDRNWNPLENLLKHPETGKEVCAACGTEVVIKTVNRRKGKRKESVDQHGFDLKFAYHVVRLLNECEQILTEGDLDLMRNREQLKAIRNGEWTLEMVEDYFTKKESELESVYNNSKLPWGPKEDGLQDRIKQLLFHCLEEHYGSLDKCIVNQDAAVLALREVSGVLDKYRKLL